MLTLVVSVERNVQIAAMVLVGRRRQLQDQSQEDGRA